MRMLFIAALAVVSCGVVASADEPLVRADFAFDGMSGMLGWEAPETKGGAASVAATVVAGPSGAPVVQFTGKAESCKLVSMPISLAPGEPYRFSIKVRTRGFSKKAGAFGVRQKLCAETKVSIDIPADTKGEWRTVEKTTKLPANSKATCEFFIAAYNLRGDTLFEVCDPVLEPLSDVAKSKSAPVGVAAPVIGRIVPVEPLLSEVDATTGTMRFVANVPTNGCEIVATVDGKPLGPVAPGRHKVVVRLVEKATGKVRIENTYPFIAKMPKPARSVGRRLNNFVTEVVSTALRDGEYDFCNPRKGWVFIALEGAGMDAKAYLGGFEGAVVEHRDGEPPETLRLLDEGDYKLTVKGSTGGRLKIHLVKPTLVGFSNPWREGGFRSENVSDNFGYEFMRRNAFKSMADVAIRFQEFYRLGATDERRAWVVDQLRRRGKRVFSVSACMPSEFKSRTSLASQRKLFCERKTFREGFPVSYDECGLHMSMRELNCCGEAAWEAAEMMDDRPIYMDWFGITGKTIENFDPVVALMSAIVNAGQGTGYLMSESYVGSHADFENSFEKSIQNIKANHRALARMMPAVGKRIIHNLSGFQTIGGWTNHLVPQVDRKVAMENLVRRLACDPDFADVGGLSFSAPRCSEELLRWGVELIHHYAIEGRTDSISEARGWRIFPKTVADGDFVEGLKHWTASAGEQGSLVGSSRTGFARNVQHRNCASHEEGDFFAVFRRSEKAPNRLSQTIRNLVPGRRYVLEYACSNLDDVEKPGSDRVPDLALRSEVVGMPFDPFLTVENIGGGRSKKRAHVLSVRHVFRATAAEGELVFSDWASDSSPGGAAGRRLTLNYVAVTPYFEPEPGQLDDFYLAVPGTAREFNVRDRGAVGDGAAKDTAAVQRTIDECAAAGGGRVVLPKGTYLCGSVYLKSNVELHLEKGATLLGSPDLADYCDEKTYPQNFFSTYEGWGPQHLLLAIEQSNVALTGEGVVDGNGRAFFDMTQERWIGTGAWRRGAYGAKDDKRPGQMIVFVESQDIRVEGVTLRDSTAWNCLFHGCERVRVKGVTVRNDQRHLTTDGFDVDSCRDVEISGCDIETGDDSFAVRGSPYRLKDKTRVCEDVYIHDSKGRTSACGVRVGVGNGTIRRVRLENLDLSGAGMGLQVQCKYGTRGTGKGVDISDVSFRDVRLYDVATGISAIAGPGNPTATMENVSFEDVVIDACKLPVLVMGGERSRPRHIRFERVLVRAQPASVYNIRDKNGDFVYPGIDENVRIQSADDVVLVDVERMQERTRVPATVAKRDVGEGR